MGEDVSYGETGGANNGSFFGIAKGAEANAGSKNDPHRLTVTPFEQLLQGV